MRLAFTKIMPVAILSFAAAVSGQTREPCSVVRIIDHRRIELTSGEIIGLIGVQPFSKPQTPAQSTAFLDSLLIGKPLALEFDDNLPPTFGYLWRDTVLVNVELLRRGLAQVWSATLNFKYQKEFFAAERESRAAQRGNWKFADLFSAAVDTAMLVDDDTVYVSKSGRKYHQLNCRLLSANKIALPLAKARLAHTPCRLCAVSKIAPQENLPLQSEGRTIAAQCLAKTKSGGRCKREAVAGSKYCWQHRQK